MAPALERIICGSSPSLKEMIHNKRFKKVRLGRQATQQLLGISGSQAAVKRTCKVVQDELSAQGLNVSLPIKGLHAERTFNVDTPYGKLLEYVDVKIGEETLRWLTVNPFALIVHSALQQPKFAKLLHDSLNGATASLVFYTDGFNGGDPLNHNSHVKLMNAVLQRAVNIFTHSLLSIYIYIYVSFDVLLHCVILR